MTKQTSNGELPDNNQNPDGQADKTYTEEEYKNAQAFGTKANQQLISISKQLAEQNPKSLKWMEANIQEKVIKEIWGYDNVEELNIMMPELFDEDVSPSWDGDSMEDMKKRQILLERKLDEKNIKDEIDRFEMSNNNITKVIPNFWEKVREELKYISSSLPAKDRVDRASRLVTNSRGNIDVESFLALQGRNQIKWTSTQTSDEKMKETQNELRRHLWLKSK